MTEERVPHPRKKARGRGMTEEEGGVKPPLHGTRKRPASNDARALYGSYGYSFSGSGYADFARFCATWAIWAWMAFIRSRASATRLRPSGVASINFSKLAANCGPYAARISPRSG